MGFPLITANGAISDIVI